MKNLLIHHSRLLKGMALLFIACNCMFFSCKTQHNDPQRIKGKLVHTSCASAVVQVLDAEYNKLGQESWQQSEGKPVYQYVFAVKNQCAFKRNGIKVGDEFYFQVTDKDEKDCAVCMMWDNPPTIKQNVIVIK